MSFDVTITFSHGDGDYDERLAHTFNEQVMERFRGAPEFAALPEGSFGAWPLLNLAADQLGLAISELTPGDLEEVLFGLFPRKLSCEAESAPFIIAELRAFWRWLDREFQLPNAPACLQVLDHQAVERLRRELSDPSNFGMAKSFVMRGRELGFDIENPDEMEAYIALYNMALLNQARGLPPGGVPRLPPSDHWVGTPPGQNAKKSRRKKRKQQRANRKRNR